jgi:hypothetical protein
MAFVIPEPCIGTEHTCASPKLGAPSKSMTYEEVV